MKAALLICALLLVACDTNECGSVDLRYLSLTDAEVTFDIDCPGGQDISPGNTFDGTANLPGGLTAAPMLPKPPKLPYSVQS